MSDDTELLKRAESTEEVDVEEIKDDDTAEFKAEAPKEKGRRVRVYSVNTRAILNVFFQPISEFVEHPSIDPLPEGFKVLGAQLNWMTNCLDVMVEHHSFDLVPDGELPPNAVGMKTTMKVYKVQEAV